MLAYRLKVKKLKNLEEKKNIKRIYLRKYSKTVWKYIRNENKRFPVYIIHRVRVK